MMVPKITASLIAAALVCVGCASSSSGIERVESGTIESVESGTIEPAEPEILVDQTWSTLGVVDAQQGAFRRVYVLVPAGLEDSGIVKITDELRRQADADPANSEVEFVEHYLFDDASEMDTLLTELPNTEAGDSSRWPVDYVTDHTVATSKGVLVPDGEGAIDRQCWLCLGYDSCDEDMALAVYDA